MSETIERPFLVTGFETFGEWQVNPSQQVIESLVVQAKTAGHTDRLLQVLPTEYHAAGQRVQELIAEHDPSIVLFLGLSTARAQICLERFALNVDDVESPDNADTVRDGYPIDPDGPLALKTPVALKPLLSRLLDQGIDAVISNHAGTYVCNHVYYQGLRAINHHGNRADCLFVHLPMTQEGLTPEQARLSELIRQVDPEPTTRWSSADLIAAVSLIIDGLIKQRSAALNQV